MSGTTIIAQISIPLRGVTTLYSGDETLIRFINYLRRHWLEQKVHLRGLSGNSLFCIFMIFDDVLLMP